MGNCVGKQSDENHCHEDTETKATMSIKTKVEVEAVDQIGEDAAFRRALMMSSIVHEPPAQDEINTRISTGGTASKSPKECSGRTNIRKEFKGRMAQINQKVLSETLAKFKEHGREQYRNIAKSNLERWSTEVVKMQPEVSSSIEHDKEKETNDYAKQQQQHEIEFRIIPKDWGEVTLQMTQEFGERFAVLYAANSSLPGSLYLEGGPELEENIFRRTDCHYSLDESVMDPEMETYWPEYKDLLGGKHGYVYLDTHSPRICIRGSMDRDKEDFGYPWLADDEIFSFYDMRAAPVSTALHDFNYKDGMRNLIKAQLDTLIEKGIRHVVFTAFGCGTRADNPGKQVAAIYKEEIEERREHFDVVAFSVLLRFPNNYVPFAEAFGVENRIIAKHTNSVAAWKNKGNMSDFIMSLHKKKAKRILRNAQMRGEL